MTASGGRLGSRCEKEGQGAAPKGVALSTFLFGTGSAMLSFQDETFQALLAWGWGCCWCTGAPRKRVQGAENKEGVF